MTEQSKDRKVKIEKVVYGGKGLSRDLEKVAFAPFVLPGETVRLQVTREHRDYLEALPVEIVEPSARRVSPACPYYGRCGGCQLSHTDYETQLEMKREMLLETLKRNKIDTPAIEVFPSPAFSYRHRIRLKYNAKGPAIGFFEMDSNAIVDIKECLCATPGLNRLIATLRSVLLAKPVPRVTEIECFENDRGETVAHCNAPLPDDVRAELNAKAVVFDSQDRNRDLLLYHFRDFEFPMSPDVFLQVNPFLMNVMVQEVESHHPPSREEAVELYSGTGLFTVPLTRRFSKILACEENQAAVQFARDHYSLPNIQWVRSSADHLRFPESATVLIVDPPRTGLSPTVIENVLRHPFSRITYVSCDPPSFARDVKKLTVRYKLNRLSLLDLFPQTTHFETIALLNSVSP